MRELALLRRARVRAACEFFGLDPDAPPARLTRQAVKKAYIGKRNWVPVVELLFGLYFTGAVYFAWDKEIWTSVPFLVLFQVGFLYVGVTSMLEFRGKAKAAATAPAAAQPTV